MPELTLNESRVFRGHHFTANVPKEVPQDVYDAYVGRHGSPVGANPGETAEDVAELVRQRDEAVSQVEYQKNQFNSSWAQVQNELTAVTQERDEARALLEEANAQIVELNKQLEAAAKPARAKKADNADSE